MKKLDKWVKQLILAITILLYLGIFFLMFIPKFGTIGIVLYSFGMYLFLRPLFKNNFMAMIITLIGSLVPIAGLYITNTYNILQIFGMLVVLMVVIICTISNMEIVEVDNEDNVLK